MQSVSHIPTLRDGDAHTAPVATPTPAHSLPRFQGGGAPLPAWNPRSYHNCNTKSPILSFTKSPILSLQAWILVVAEIPVKLHCTGAYHGMFIP